MHPLSPSQEFRVDCELSQEPKRPRISATFTGVLFFKTDIYSDIYKGGAPSPFLTAAYIAPAEIGDAASWSQHSASPPLLQEHRGCQANALPSFHRLTNRQPQSAKMPAPARGTCPYPQRLCVSALARRLLLNESGRTRPQVPAISDGLGDMLRRVLLTRALPLGFTPSHL